MSESHDREFERLEDAWREEVAKLDRTLLTLSTGVLALSAALVRDQAGELEWACLLLLGWLAVLASIVFIVWSYTITKQAIESRLLDDEHGSNEDETQRLSRKAWTRTLMSAWSLVIGATLLIFFTWLNVT